MVAELAKLPGCFIVHGRLGDVAVLLMNAATSSNHATQVNAPNRRRFWQRRWPHLGSGGVTAYLVCVATVTSATLLRFALDPLLGEHHAFTLYFAAVAITAWFGGFAPSLAATLLAYFSGDWFFISPRHQVKWPHVNLDDFIALAAFLFSCLAIAVTSKLMRDAVVRAQQKQAQLEHEVEERRRVEETLRETQAQLSTYAGSLENRVTERTANLQATIRSLEGVCYHIAHDLRAPLRAMDGFSTILLREYASHFDEDGLYILKQIVDSSGRMDLLIQGLLAYGRLGHAQFPLSSLSPKPVILRVIEKLNPEISSKQADIRVAADWTKVLANEGLLETVVTSILKNALKFVADGVPPKITIREEPGESSARIWIEDKGIGIDSEWLDRVFRIFERVHPYEEYPGTGIGLAIAAKAMERMRGKIGVESTIGKGSRFWFELPRAPS